MKNSIVGDLVLEYLKKYEGLGLKTIGRILHKRHPEHFSSVEQARGRCRYYSGSFGQAQRKHRKLEKSTHNGDFHRKNPFGLPNSDTREYTPYKLSDRAQKVLMISDVHVPHHDMQALTAVIKRGKEIKPDTLLINGDFMDCHMLSRFEKDPGARKFKDEIIMVRQLLDKLCNEISPDRVVYKQGNHEERYDKYMAQRAPELLEIDHYRFDNVLCLPDMDIDWVDEKRVIHAGKLSIVHGHEYVKAVLSPVNPARSYYMKAKAPIVVGHHHQTSEHTEPTIKDEIITAWSMGCLCDLHPRYMPLNRWNHGFAELELSKNGDFHLQNRRIHDGKIL